MHLWFCLTFGKIGAPQFLFNSTGFPPNNFPMIDDISSDAVTDVRLRNICRFIIATCETTILLLLPGEKKYALLLNVV